VNQTDTLVAERFGTTRTADFEFEIPSRLPVGSYVAIVEASAVERPKATRTVRFSVSRKP
jgi:hypothetical protein